MNRPPRSLCSLHADRAADSRGRLCGCAAMRRAFPVTPVAAARQEAA